MFWKMIFGAIKRQKRRHFLIALSVFLGISLATAMLGVMFDIGDKVNMELKSYGANLNVLPKGASLLGELYKLDEVKTSGELNLSDYIREDDLYKIKMIFWAYNIVDFTPYLTTRAQIGQTEIFLYGTWFNHLINLPTGESLYTGMTPLKSWWEVEGESGDENDLSGVLVGKVLARKLDLEVGSSFQLKVGDNSEEVTLKVRGIFSSGDSEDSAIFAPLSLVQKLSGREGLVERVEVSALTTPENDLARRAAQNPQSLSRIEWDTWYCTAYISAIAYQIEEIMPQVRVKPVRSVAQSEGMILEKTELMIILLTILTLLCSALAISNLVTTNIMERSVEIGLIKAIGAKNYSICLLVLAEMFLVSLAGGLLGYVAGLGLARLIGYFVFGSVVELKTVVIPLSFIMVLLITVLGSLPALRSLLHLRPTLVLHGKQ